MKKPPRRNVGELGSFRITATDEGHVVERMNAEIPDRKEPAEALFGSIFIDTFNRQLPLGTDYRIWHSRQNATDERDFSIVSPKAIRLELAELTPLSQPFGREAKRTGSLNVHTYATWIYEHIVDAKAKKYLKNGLDVGSMILALYLTHMEFAPSESTVDCLRQLCKERGCPFDAVFLLLTNGSDLRVLYLVYPFPLAAFPPSEAYKGLSIQNLTFAEGVHGDVVAAVPYGGDQH